MKIEIVGDGRVRASLLWQNSFDQPVIEAGATAERILPVTVAQKTATAYVPGIATNNTIVIRTAVFDDLTFDGDEEAACQYEKFVVGRRLWVKRVLPLIESELANQALRGTFQREAAGAELRTRRERKDQRVPRLTQV